MVAILVSGTITYIVKKKSHTVMILICYVSGNGSSEEREKSCVLRSELCMVFSQRSMFEVVK